MSNIKTMTELLILIPIAQLHITEAYLEAEYWDKKHWPSLLIQFFISVLLGLALPFNDWLDGFLAFIAVRVWFDYAYNAFRGVHWSYVGTHAKTDLLIRWLENKFGGAFISYFLIFVRLAVCTGALMLLTK